jgi:DNA-binding GntR family transcriptional regulator
MKQSEIAYQRFKEKLFAHDLLPGQFISQRELASMSGTTLGPTREALLKLQFEGLVNVLPQHGIQIAETDLKRIRNTYQLRILVEKDAVMKFAEWADEQQIEALRKDHLKIAERARKERITAGLIADAEDVDWGMHDAIVGALQNEFISQIHMINCDRIKVFRLDYGHTASSLIDTMNEHLAILDACAGHDSEKAAHAMKVHISAAMQRAMGV